MTVLDRDALKARVDALIRNETEPDTISPTDVSDVFVDVIDSCWNTTDGTAETLTAGDVVSNGDVTATDDSSGDSGTFTTLNITNLLTNTFAANAGSELTIASGVISVTNMAHVVDTESDAATDNLDTISDPGFPVWSILLLKPASDSRTIVIRDDQGNLHTPGSLDVTLANTTDVAMLVKVGANAWFCFFAGETGVYLPLAGGTMTGAILGSSNPDVGDATTGRMGVGYFTSIDVTGNVDGVDVSSLSSSYTSHAAASNPHSGSASTADLAAYLPLAGGTMTGAILGSSNPAIGDATTGRMGTGYLSGLDIAGASLGIRTLSSGRLQIDRSSTGEWAGQFQVNPTTGNLAIGLLAGAGGSQKNVVIYNSSGGATQLYCGSDYWELDGTGVATWNVDGGSTMTFGDGFVGFPELAAAPAALASNVLVHNTADGLRAIDPDGSITELTAVGESV